MYAVIVSGGKQYRVAPGDELRVELLTGEPGDPIELRPVMIVDDAGTVSVGEALASRTVSATITGHGKGRKITVSTYKNKSRQRRKIGHRQRYTTVRVESV